MHEFQVVHFIPSLSTGGAESMLFKLLNADQENSPKAVVTMFPGGRFERQVTGLGVQVVSLDVKRLSSLLHRIRALNKILSQSNVTVLCGWMYYGAILAIFLKTLGILTRAPTRVVVCNVRHSLSDLPKEKRRIRLAVRLIKLLRPLITHFIFNSHISKREHCVLWGTSLPASVIPNGFETGDWIEHNKARSTLCSEQYPWLAKNSWVFGHVGRVHPMKNHLGLLQAFDHVAQVNSRARLVLVGRGTELLDLGMIQAKSRVHPLGEREDVQDLMVTFDALVLCSSYGEGFPNVVGEAMLKGLPVIVTDVGDSALMTGGHGIAVPVNSPSHLYHAMCEVMSWDVKRLESVRVRSRQHIVDNYDILAVADRYEKLWRDLYQQTLS